MGSGGGYAQGMESAHRPIAYRWLGRLGYDEAHAEQRRLVDDRVGGSGVDAFLALEHEPVLTLGKNATLAHLHLSEAEYAARGIALRRGARG
jgi:lipoyl(octanoyl) transferase